MKKYLLSILFFASSLFGMDDAKVTTYFLPESQSIVFNKLMQLLDSARSKICIAMYWFTDYRVAEKLAELSNKGIQVQVIIDHSNFDGKDNSQRILETLIDNNVPWDLRCRKSFNHKPFYFRYHA